MDSLLVDTSNYELAQGLFVQLLGFCYFWAFFSLFKQVLGLYGSQGIIPIDDTLTMSHESTRQKTYFRVPTIFWFNSSDKALKWTAGFGCVISICVMFKIWPAFFLLMLWIGYLSYVSIGLVFLSFQWDSLLLEVGFIGIFFSIQTPPPFFLLFAVWFLLFRFMFSSGIVKYLSEDPEWRSLKAMAYHYETQPIPNLVAYYVHQQPMWLAKLSTLGTFVIELIAPFLIFGTNFIRLIACILLLLFQLFILLTGNFAFFNLLTIALCCTLIPNQYLEWIKDPVSAHAEAPNPFVHFSLEVIGVMIIFLNALELSRLLTSSRLVDRILRTISPYYITNSYGLFARMTTTRDEIIVEGSIDGKEWKTYEFKWKPGNLYVAPCQVAPYQPRLDWQMWFAALGTYHANLWFINFLIRLLEGSKDVLALLRVNPFPDYPPTYIRTRLYRYQ